MIFLTPAVVFNEKELELLTEIEKSRLKLISDRDLEGERRWWLEQRKK
jgi:hypothetical protein